MAVICEKYGFIYIQVPGTGCSVISRVLREQFGGKDLGRKHNDIQEIVAKGLLSEKELKKYIVVANVRNPFDRIVTYYQRLKDSWTEEYLAWAQRDLERQCSLGNLSPDLYRKRVEILEKVGIRKRRRARIIQSLGFNIWLQAAILRWYIRAGSRPTGYQEYLFPMLAGVDIVLRQEYLEESFNELLLFLGIDEKVSLPRKNLTTGKKSFTSYYNQLNRWLLGKLFSDELNKFGYRFDGVVDGDAIVHLTNRLEHKADQ